MDETIVYDGLASSTEIVSKYDFIRKVWCVDGNLRFARKQQDDVWESFEQDFYEESVTLEDAMLKLLSVLDSYARRSDELDYIREDEVEVYEPTEDFDN